MQGQAASRNDTPATTDAHIAHTMCTGVDPTDPVAELKRLLDSKGVQYLDHELQLLHDTGWVFESRLADASVQDLMGDGVSRALAKALVKAFAAGAHFMLASVYGI